MYLPDFDYYLPATVDEACLILSRLGGKTRALAGGTDLLPQMKNETIAPVAFVSLKEINGLNGIAYVQGRGLIIGAMSTANEIANSTLLQERFLSVSDAAHSMANNQIRNRATIGGNLVSAVPSADLPPILIALDARITLAGPRETRTMLLEKFFVGSRCSIIAPDEILTEIVIPDQATNGSAYLKFGLRHSGALAVVGVAVSVVAKGNHIEGVRIVLGAVAPTPMRAFEAERLLIGNSVTEALLEVVGKTASKECRPISDIRGSEDYRQDMVRVFVKRALRKALKLTKAEARKAG